MSPGARVERELAPGHRRIVPDMSQADRQAIADLYRAWYDALAAGDTEAQLERVTDDIVLKGPGAPPVEGKTALRRVLREFHGRFAETVEFEVLETGICGEWAFARIAETARIRPREGGREIEISGQHLSILRRGEDGTWRVARDVASLDRPLGG
jgi:uncharacterized protein (TIGR02246 family)